VSILFAFVALRLGASPLVALAALPLSDGLNLALLWLRSGVPLRLKFGFYEPLSILRESFPVGLMAVCVIIYFRVDNLLVFKFAGASALGLYAACYRIIEPALMVPSSFSGTTYSLLSSPQQQHAGTAEVRDAVIKTMWPAYAFIFAVSSLLFFSGKWFLQHVLPGYLPGYTILLVLTGALLVRSVNVGVTAVLNSRAKYSTLAKISGATLAVNLLLVFLLVPPWGAVGAAWAAVFTEVFNCCLQGRSLAALFISLSSRPALESVVSSD
jgi:O-antigen/teichoic acid export membrane protein